MPLQQALRVSEAAIFLGRRSRRHEKDFRLDRFRIGTFGIFIPEARALDLEPISHHEPVEFAERRTIQSRVGSAASRILAKQKQAFDFAFGHADEVWKL